METQDYIYTNTDMTPEEIKKIAREYAEEYYKNVLRFCHDLIPDSIEALIKRKQKQIIEILELLSKNYYIVSKSKVKELYAKTESDHCHVDKDNDWVVDMMLGRMEDIFGKEMFEEKGK